MKVSRKGIKRLIATGMAIGLVGAVTVFAVDQYVRDRVAERIITLKTAETLEDTDCILVLGCGLRQDGTPSKLLTDRLNEGTDLYLQGVAPKLLMSGDHGQTEYDEVNAMKKYGIDLGIPSEDIFMDHAGFSTYESIYRAKEIFKAEKLVIVTQEYHLYRALYLAEVLGLEAYGVSADRGEHPGALYREFREKLARTKDFFWGIAKPKPTYLGEAIPVQGNGDLTND